MLIKYTATTPRTRCKKIALVLGVVFFSLMAISTGFFFLHSLSLPAVFAQGNLCPTIPSFTPSSLSIYYNETVTITLTAQDPEGNWSKSPDWQIIAEVNGVFDGSRSASGEFTNGNNASQTATRTFSAANIGDTMRFTALVTDGSNCSSASLAVTVSVVNASPSVSIPSPANGGTVGFNTDVAFSYSVSDYESNVASWSLKAYDNATSAFLKTIRSGTGEGSFTDTVHMESSWNNKTVRFTLLAQDSYGASGFMSIALLVDNTAPVIDSFDSIPAPGSIIIYGVPVNIDFTFQAHDENGNWDGVRDWEIKTSMALL